MRPPPRTRRLLLLGWSLVGAGRHGEAEVVTRLVAVDQVRSARPSPTARTPSPSIDEDRTTDVLICDNPSDYIAAGTGQMRSARVSYYDPGLPIAGWFGEIDQAIWRVGVPSPLSGMAQETIGQRPATAAAGGAVGVDLAAASRSGAACPRSRSRSAA